MTAEKFEQVNARLTPTQAAWLDSRADFNGRAAVVRALIDAAMRAEMMAAIGGHNESAMLSGAGGAGGTVR